MQLPHGAEGAAALSMIFAYISETCSILMIWLTWSHNERLSYVACVSYFTLLSTAASIIQQIHDIIWWKNIVTKQYERKIADPHDGDVSIGNGSIGVDLVLFYIQFYSYNVQSLFVTFWASELAQSIYALTEKSSLKYALRRFNASAKVVALLLPLITILAVQAPSLHHAGFGFELLAGVPFLLTLGLGSALMLAILIRYVQSRRKIIRFNPFGNQRSSTDRVSSANGNTSGRRQGIYDKWLMTRFTIAFVLLAGFIVITVLFQGFARRNTSRDILAPEPDLSIERARSTFYLFIPGNTPGIGLFIVFGTTATFRSQMYRTFVPRCFRHERGVLPVLDPNSSVGSRGTKGSNTLSGQEERSLGVIPPESSHSAGLSLAVYEPVRPPRVATPGSRPAQGYRDLEAAARDYDSIIISNRNEAHGLR
ncbi:hypothetical protein F5Y18DRAFT_259231 [Xylariaceae sp. FL1019]|nr:hypothetical protein F5Y18DRAFT_259231 [Xylariaceae sp. FL1019]